MGVQSRRAASSSRTTCRTTSRVDRRWTCSSSASSIVMESSSRGSHSNCTPGVYRDSSSVESAPRGPPVSPISARRHSGHTVTAAATRRRFPCPASTSRAASFVSSRARWRQRHHASSLPRRGIPYADLRNVREQRRLRRRSRSTFQDFQEALARHTERAGALPDHPSVRSSRQSRCSSDSLMSPPGPAQARRLRSPPGEHGQHECLPDAVTAVALPWASTT